MLKYLSIVPLLIVGTLGYAAQAVYGDTMIPPITSTFTGKSVTERRTTQVAKAAEASAEAFAERIAALDSLVATSTLDTTDAVVFRSAITDRFHEAFTAITRLEDQGRFEKASGPREIMQIAIEQHMEYMPDNTPAITRDLETFSKFMTKTLINRSFSAAS